jgi:NTF2 fold immunity protein
MKTSLSIILLVSVVIVGVNACKKQTFIGPKKQDRAVTNATEPKSDLPGNSFTLQNGYVPDEQTAIAIAVAAWIPIYGKAQIENEKPYKATLKDGVWTVTGTVPPGYDGGTALAEIAQADGRILRVIHYQ